MNCNSFFQLKGSARTCRRGPEKICVLTDILSLFNKVAFTRWIDQDFEEIGYMFDFWIPILQTDAAYLAKGSNVLVWRCSKGVSM